MEYRWGNIPSSHPSYPIVPPRQSHTLSPHTTFGSNEHQVNVRRIAFDTHKCEEVLILVVYCAHLFTQI